VTAQAAPPFPFGGPTSAAWREEALTKTQELRGLADWFGANGAAPDPGSMQLAESIRRHLDAARDTAWGQDDDRGRFARLVSTLRGSAVERTLGNLDAVEVDLLRLASMDYVRGQMPSLQAHVNRFLAKDDPRRVAVSRLAGELTRRRGALESYERDMLLAAYHAASSQRRRELIRVRSFRNVILGATLLLTVVAVGLGFLGAVRPDAMPLCFTPESGQVCPLGGKPTSSDIWVIELIGLVSASVAGAFTLRHIRGTSTPYSLPVALTLLKLPSGALTAVLGLQLMRGAFVPGLSALDTDAQIVSWAIVFGYAQQLFTRLVDDQASSVLEQVGGRGAAGDRGRS
jgi:hypothetical protein